MFVVGVVASLPKILGGLEVLGVHPLLGCVGLGTDQILYSLITPKEFTIPGELGFILPSSYVSACSEPELKLE